MIRLHPCISTYVGNVLDILDNVSPVSSCQTNCSLEQASSRRPLLEVKQAMSTAQPAAKHDQAHGKPPSAAHKQQATIPPQKQRQQAAQKQQAKLAFAPKDGSNPAHKAAPLRTALDMVHPGNDRPGDDFCFPALLQACLSHCD